MLNDISNFFKWIARKALIINEVSNASKIASFFVFLYEGVFLIDHSYFTYNLNNT